MDILPSGMLINLLVLIAAFAVLSKGADYLVDGAVGVAVRMEVPKMIIGIVLVGFGTTAPEFTVSVISAAQRHSEIALGNAVGSVIVNVGAALALGVLLSPRPLKLEKSLFLSVLLLFGAAAFLAFAVALDGVISRVEGSILLTALGLYVFYLLRRERRRKRAGYGEEVLEELAGHDFGRSLAYYLLVFLGGLVAVVIASKFLVEAAVNIANRLHISKTIIGLTVVAIGTSLPEVATAIVASRKGHGDLAFGDIMGANMLNLLWITGAASLARPIVVSEREIFFMFPCMIGVVGTMFVLGRIGYNLNRIKAFVLLLLYAGYAVATALLFIHR